MTSLRTIAFSGTSSVLQANFFPEITIDSDSNYSCALLDLIIYDSDDLGKIKKLEVIRIECDIISESYINGERTHTIHQFATRASSANNKTFVEIPKHLNYLPVKTKNLRSIQISITDRMGKLVDISGLKIICRINIKRDKIEK